MNVPELRFSEFADEWKRILLSEISERVMYGMNSAGISFDGENKYLRITDINENTRKFTPNPLASPDGKIEDKYRLKEGDIVFARTGASVGKSYLFDKKDGNLFFAGFLIKFSITKGNPFFIFTQTLRDNYNKWVQLMSMRSGQPGINAEEYKSYSFLVPSLSEQKKIATFLTSVDDKLTQLKKKKTLLEQYKKGVMQKIFSQEIRFKDENGNEFPKWEIKKIGNIGKFIGGGTPSTKNTDFWNGDIPWISSSDIPDNSIYQINVTRFISNDAVLQSATKLIPKQSILIVSRVGVGKVAVNEVELCTSQDFTNLIVNSDNYKFLAYLIKFKTNKLLEFNQGTSIKGFVKSDLEDLEIFLPCLSEQTKIANFLSAIDEKINYCSTQIEKTTLWKKGLLQKMFV